jgi:murein DD-endopeptidase MepM/ murein hydrolase activator NlpD
MSDDMGVDPFDVIKKARQLSLMRPTWPLASFTVSKFGAYGVRRFRIDQGACGVHGFPCTHWGVDMSAPPGSAVVVPFSGFVLYHGPADKPPFVGYGPWVALIAHADTETPLSQKVWEWATGPLLDIADLPSGAKSVRYSLLAHLAAPQPGEVGPQPQTLAEFPLVSDIWDAAKKKPNEDHWRVRKTRPSNVVMYDGADGASMSRIVFAGQPLGAVAESAHPHVHWELRTAPITPAEFGNWRLDPIDVFNNGYGVPLPSGVPPRTTPTPQAARAGGGSGWALLLAALAFGAKKKRGRR